MTIQMTDDRMTTSTA